jgi:hypothetical protein
VSALLALQTSGNTNSTTPVTLMLTTGTLTPGGVYTTNMDPHTPNKQSKGAHIMKPYRLASLILLAVLATTLTATTAASASAPEFKPGTLNRFTADSGTGALETASTSAITCTNDSVTGEVTGPKTIGSVIITFHGCQSTEKGGCSLQTNSATPGLITTNTLKGELGTTKEATSGVGLLIEPATGTAFATLEGTCLLVSPSPVTGSIAGEVTPVNNGATKDNKLVFLGSKGKQKIKEINILGVVKKPAFKALGLLESSETTNELVLYEKAVEVT